MNLNTMSGIIWGADEDREPEYPILRIMISTCTVAHFSWNAVDIMRGRSVTCLKRILVIANARLIHTLQNCFDCASTGSNPNLRKGPTLILEAANMYRRNLRNKGLQVTKLGRHRACNSDAVSCNKHKNPNRVQSVENGSCHSLGPVNNNPVLTECDAAVGGPRSLRLPEFDDLVEREPDM